MIAKIPFLLDNFNNKMPDIEGVVKVYKGEIEPYIDQWQGFFCLLFLTFFFEYSLLKFLGINILTYSKLDLELFASLSIILIFIYWIYLRRVPSFKKEKCGYFDRNY